MEPAKSDGVVSLSRAEAKQAWLAEGSDLERAARQALRERLAKVRDTLFNIVKRSYMLCF